MRMLIKMFVAFCIGTVLAQGVILAMVAARGNLNSVTLLKAVALLNGVDITGERLQKMLEDSKQSPNPSYEDVVAERAIQNKSLDMRERSVLQQKALIEERLAEHKQQTADFDRRKDEFYALLESMDKDLANDSLTEVARTLETLTPDQAKNQIKKFLESNQMEDVVAIVKGMPLDKRKKILGEFTTQEEIAQLNEILVKLRQGDPKASVIKNAREQAAIQ